MSRGFSTVGDQHDLVGVQEPGGLGHEMDARQHNDIGLGTRGLARERQAVADDVGDRWKMSGV
jgi:hypothetical protein